MPNFLVIGASSSGTTSIYHYLKQHPQVFMSPIKETHFFSFAGQEFAMTTIKGYKQRKVDSLDEYKSLFQDVSDEIAIGEVSPSYLYTPSSPERIKQSVPNAKLIAILRNPVDRAYSNYLRCVRNDQEPITDFAEALRQEPIRIQNNWSPKWFYKSKGFYYEQLKRYFEVFDKNQIQIYLYEDLCDSPSNLMQNLFEFLDVDSTFVPNISEKKNVSYIPKNRLLQKFLKKTNIIKSIVKPLLSEKLRHRAVTNLKIWNQSKPLLLPDIRKQLTQEYREDILKLQDLLQKDLSHWLY
jgi:hypothetical protein